MLVYEHIGLRGMHRAQDEIELLGVEREDVGQVQRRGKYRRAEEAVANGGQDQVNKILNQKITSMS